jgi:hypothetical protein
MMRRNPNEIYSSESEEEINYKEIPIHYLQEIAKQAPPQPESTRKTNVKENKKS